MAHYFRIFLKHKIFTQSFLISLRYKETSSNVNICSLVNIRRHFFIRSFDFVLSFSNAPVNNEYKCELRVYCIRRYVHCRYSMYRVLRINLVILISVIDQLIRLTCIMVSITKKNWRDVIVIFLKFYFHTQTCRLLLKFVAKKINNDKNSSFARVWGKGWSGL